MSPLITTLGGLRCRILQETQAGPDAVVVLCHGFGAPGDDLVPLGAHLAAQDPQLQQRVRFVFPEAPLTLQGFGGRAWWMIPLDRMMALQRGDPRAAEALAREVPEELPHARKLLLSLLQELSTQLKLPQSKLILGGFSQGAMLATDVTLRLEEPPAALSLFSGALICQEEWTRRAAARRGLRVFQSHGRQDPILPFASAEALRGLLTEAGLEVDFLPFHGEHTIPLEALEKLGALVRATLG